MKILINYLSCAAAKLIGTSSSTSSTSNSKGHHHHNHDHHRNYKIMNNDDELIAKSREDKQESVELDPSELPSLYESDFDVEEDHHQVPEVKGQKEVKDGMSQICMYEEGSWQILVSKPRIRREPRTFYDVLSFWKSKEKGEEVP